MRRFGGTDTYVATQDLQVAAEQGRGRSIDEVEQGQRSDEHGEDRCRAGCHYHSRARRAGDRDEKEQEGEGRRRAPFDAQTVCNRIPRREKQQEEQ